jgi:8-oxo-(d)GTP phosphatase
VSRAVSPSSGDVVLAAGAVLWREEGGRLEVAVVHRPRYDDWSLPKGKLDPGEHLLEAAVREVAEETGCTAVLGRPLGATSYQALGRPKRVTYWAAQATGGTFSPHEEIDGLEWLPVEAARDRVHRESDRAVLAEFRRGPHRTFPVVILRHAKAMPRKAWNGPDPERPLRPEGLQQAQRLPGLLAVWRLERVLSSPEQRCVQTVEPFLAAGAAELLDALSEHGHEEDPEGAVKVLESLVQDGTPALVCTHRPVLPPLVERSRRLADVRIDLDLDGFPLRPAEMLVLHAADGRVVAAERHRP